MSRDTFETRLQRLEQGQRSEPTAPLVREDTRAPGPRSRGFRFWSLFWALVLGAIGVIQGLVLSILMGFVREGYDAVFVLQTASDDLEGRTMAAIVLVGIIFVILLGALIMILVRALQRKRVLGLVVFVATTLFVFGVLSSASPAQV